MAYMPSKVIVMAPTWRQVDAIVWNEMRAAYRALSVDAEWGLRMFPGSPQIESTTMQGVPLRVVMEILGHSLLATTADIYTHVLPVLMADAAEKMDAVLA